ncbi:MAG: ubiquinone/menaquinone biosynthesis methyltransferase [Chloroflexota bacterium]
MTFNSPEEKYTYVNDMFGRIAQRYDVMNKIMTVGQDSRWRKMVVQEARLPQFGGRLLDIATGTGDIAFETLRQFPHADMVVGADFTLPMMHVGQQRNGGNFVRWSGADTMRLPFPTAYFDAVTSGFLMRNVIDVQRAIEEQARVCKPGGRVVILEIPRPADDLFGQLFRLYFHNVVPIIGGLISGQKDAYSYLPSSADAFLRPDELQTLMETVGLRQVRYKMLMFNTVALHVGEKA